MVMQCSQTTATMGRDICLLQFIAVTRVDQTVKNNRATIGRFFFSGLSLSRRSNSDLKQHPHFFSNQFDLKKKKFVYHLNCFKITQYSYATTGRDIYLLRFMMSGRSNSERQVLYLCSLVYERLSLSRWSNSGKLTRSKTAAGTEKLI